MYMLIDPAYLRIYLLLIFKQNYRYSVIQSRIKIYIETFPTQNKIYVTFILFVYFIPLLRIV